MKYILPGMGANSGMYNGPWIGLEDSCFIDWPPYRQENSIAAVAKRLVEEFPIGRKDTLIGSSLGGIVALEISQLTGTENVFLIGSAMHVDELSWLSKSLMPFARRTVVRISQLFSSMLNDPIQQMYARSDPDFIVSMSKAIFTWPGYNGDPASVHRIHGRRDHFISCPKQCEIIDSGGHLIALTHAPACVEFIKRLDVAE